VFTIGAGLLLLVLVAEYIVVDAKDANYPVAVAGLTALSFALFLVLAITLKNSGVRLIYLVPPLASSSGLISIRYIHLRLNLQNNFTEENARMAFYAAIAIAVIAGQLATALHYWALSPIGFGLALLGPSYGLTNFVGNLTDGFRNSNPLIGRNNQRPAEIEAIIESPTASATEKADALIEFMDVYKELSPVPGLNLAERADFLRWREVGITYTAPASFAQKLGFSNLSFNVSGRNLALITGYQGIDPEMNAVSGRGNGLNDRFLDGVDAWSLPLPRRVAFSVRFGF